MVQRDHRVDPRSSARGDVCRQYRNREDGHRDKDVEAWLAKVEPIEYGAENLRQRQRHHQSNGPSDRSHFHTFPQTMRRTSELLAPSAMRMPISCVRWPTE